MDVRRHEMRSSDAYVRTYVRYGERDITRRLYTVLQ